MPLKVFFVLGPPVFLILHAYVLLLFVLLAGKIGTFHPELQAQITGDDVRAQLRRQLPSNISVQSLAGPRKVRTGIIGFLMRLIVRMASSPARLSHPRRFGVCRDLSTFDSP